MPTTTQEAIMQALLAALQAGGLSVVRNTGFPEDIPASGLLVLHDGEPGEPQATLSPLTYHWQHRAELDLFAPGSAAIDKDEAFDGLRLAISAALADRTLGGLCDWIEPLAPNPADLPLTGAEPIKAATIPIVLYYATTDTLT